MPVAPTYQLAQNQRVSVEFKLFNNDGVEDPTTPAAYTFNNTLVQVTPDVSNPRLIVVKALAAGTTTNLVINRQGTAVADPLTIPFQLMPPLNISKIELVAITPLPPA